MLTREIFGHLDNGAPVEILRLGRENEILAGIITFGAAVQSLLVPDRAGRLEDVVLGHDDLAGYLARRNCFGASVGRYANRIAGAQFPLDGHMVKLPANEAPNTLHGGPMGFDRCLWAVDEAHDGPEPWARLSLVSPDGDQGFPGRLDVTVTFQVKAPRTLSILFEARTDRSTVVNLTHHGYFNLLGAETCRDILNHEVLIAAESFLPIDPGGIPLSGPERVDGTAFDFRTSERIGERIRRDGQQIRNAKGYDHCYVLPGGKTREPRFAARLAEPHSGRVLEVWTDQPGLQLYTGNNLDGTVAGKGGCLYRQSDGVCLEPQAWPDSPNRPDFPSCRLEPGETYRHHMRLAFSAV